MGLVIASSAAAGISSWSAIALAADAMGRCLDRAAVDPRLIGLMINTGVYRDDNLCEPALAPLIQQRQGLNLDPVFGGDGPIFSFDLRNGPAGFLSAVHVADSWMMDGGGEAALIVASDAHPSRRETGTGEFPFAASGAAVLLTRGDEGRGFCHFSFTDADGQGVKGYVDLQAGGSLRGALTVEIPSDYADRLLDALSHEIPAAAAAQSLDLSRCAIVSLQPHAGFRRRLARRLFIDESSIVDLELPGGFYYSTAAGTGLHRILTGQHCDGQDAVICSLPGAALSLVTAVYRH